MFILQNRLLSYKPFLFCHEYLKTHVIYKKKIQIESFWYKSLFGVLLSKNYKIKSYSFQRSKIRKGGTCFITSRTVNH